MNNTIREAKIIWLNLRSMMDDAEARGDESFLDLPFIVRDEIALLCGKKALLSWSCADELEFTSEEGEYIGSALVASYHVSNQEWPWRKMLDDLLSMTEKDEFRSMAFMIQFIQGEMTEKVFIVGGAFTALLYDRNTGAFVQAF